MHHNDGGPFLPILSRETIPFYPFDSYCVELKHNRVGGHRENTPGQFVIALQFD